MTRYSLELIREIIKKQKKIIYYPPIPRKSFKNPRKLLPGKIKIFSQEEIRIYKKRKEEV